MRLVAPTSWDLKCFQADSTVCTRPHACPFCPLLPAYTGRVSPGERASLKPA